MIYQVGTPQTYHTYMGRPQGSVGGFKQSLANCNQRAVPQDIGCKDFFLVGDTTWPGLGTVAGLIGSEVVSRRIGYPR